MNDGFVFLGHRIIRKRSRYGTMRIFTSIPREKARNFAALLTALLSSNHSESKLDMVDRINRKLKDWSAFYKFVDYRASTFGYIDHVVFWKLAHWLGRTYRSSLKLLMRHWYRSPAPGQRKTWVLFGKTNQGKLCGKELYAMVGHGKSQFRFRLPKGNPYVRKDDRKTITSRYADVAIAMSTV